MPRTLKDESLRKAAKCRKEEMRQRGMSTTRLLGGSTEIAGRGRGRMEATEKREKFMKHSNL